MWRWSGRAALHKREREAAAREAALSARAQQLHDLHESITGRVSSMVLQAGALESLTAGAGRDLDPEASHALAMAAAGIRLDGREALAELRLLDTVLPDRQGKLSP